MKEIMISFGELCQIHDTMLKMNMVLEDTKITLLQDNSSGIGYTLSVSVPIEYKGVKGDFVIDFTDESRW